ncbi:MAG TPA: hypothetical protein VF997_17985 [Polyangia bacterium]
MLFGAITLALGIVVAQADLPNANLPGNSPTLPSSNMPGPVTPDQPIVLPNTDSGGYAVTEAQALRAWQEREERLDAERQEALQLAAKAAEEAARARAEAAEANETLKNALEQRQP